MAHEFGTRLRRLRKELGLLQRDMEVSLNLRPGTESQYERGLREPGFDLLVAIAEYLEVTTDYLLGRPDAIKESPRLLAAHQRLHQQLQHAPLAAVPREKRLMHLLEMAGQASPDLFSLFRLARWLRMDEKSLREIALGQDPASYEIMTRLASYLGVNIVGEEG